MFSGNPSPLDLFRLIWKIDPDSFRASSNPLAPNVAQGTVGEIQINCSTAVNRVDFNFGPKLTTEASDAVPSVQFIEVPEQLYACFGTVIDAVSGSRLKLAAGRVAIACQFVQPETDLQSVNRTVMNTMPEPYRLNLSDEDDLIFQVNRPSVSGGGDKLNTVLNWSLVRFQLINVAVSASLGQLTEVPSAVFHTGHSLLGASLTVEVNNPADISPLDHQKQSEILSEGLRKIAQTQVEFGLNIERFRHVE